MSLTLVGPPDSEWIPGRCVRRLDGLGDGSFELVPDVVDAPRPVDRPELRFELVLDSIPGFLWEVAWELGGDVVMVCDWEVEV